jgi:hypothetical protein
MFPYAKLPYHGRAKRNTIGITKGTSAKLPHHWGHVLIYPMEKKMPFVNHFVK